jgi:hypothetical protein
VGCIRELHSPQLRLKLKLPSLCANSGDQFPFGCLSLVTLIKAFIVSRVPPGEAGSGLGWGRDQRGECCGKIRRGAVSRSTRSGREWS